jgi:hypothetical protein
MVEVMLKKLLITLCGEDIAPRFDLATEVMIATIAPDGSLQDGKTLVLAQPSAEKLCHMVITEDVNIVVCGGIEEEFYQYLTWKRITVFDSIIGAVDRVLEHLCKEELRPGDILFQVTNRQQDKKNSGQG